MLFFCLWIERSLLESGVGEKKGDRSEACTPEINIIHNKNDNTNLIKEKINLKLGINNYGYSLLQKTQNLTLDLFHLFWSQI